MDGYDNTDPATDLRPLFGNPNPTPDALSQAMRRLGMLGQLSGDRVVAPLGQSLEEEANRQRAITLQAPQRAIEALNLRKGMAEEQAWRDPAAKAILRNAIGTFMPNMQVDENTPTQVLRNILPTAERYGQSYQALMLRQALQNKLQYKRNFDQNTGRYDEFLTRPIDGATFNMDGSPRTPGVPGMNLASAQIEGLPGGAPATAPSQPGLLRSPPRKSGGPLKAPPPSPAAPPTEPPGAAPGKPAAPGASDIGQLEPIPPTGPLARDYQKMMGDLKSDMDAAKASSRSAFGQSANIIFRGLRVLPLLKQVDPKTGQPRQPTTQEWQDINAALLSMQTGGVPAQQMMNEGLPHDIQGDFAKFKSWLTSSPQSPDRQEWVDRFLNNLQREEDQAKSFQRETQFSRIPSHSRFFSLYPNRAKAALKGYGLDPGAVDQVLKTGTYTPAAEPSPAPAAGGGPAAGIKQVKSLEEARALPKGTRFLDPNGVERVR